MKKDIQLIITLFAIIKLSTASEFNTDNQNLFNNNQTEKNTIEYYSTLLDMYRNIRPIQGSLDKEKKIEVFRRLDGKIINIKWLAINNSNIIKNRNFEYNEDDLLIKITDLKNNIITKHKINFI